jgi:CubicO group peptidase (beta-lactamase class C family)
VTPNQHSTRGSWLHIRAALGPKLPWTIVIGALVVVGSSLIALTLDGMPPVAVLRSSTSRAGLDTPIRFSASGCTDNIGFLRYQWDFGDGTTGTGREISHSFRRTGDYTVTLTAVDRGGNSDSDTRRVQVLAHWPTEQWLTSTPEEQGMDPARLNQMLAVIDRDKVAIDSVIVVRHGRIVLEKYRRGWSAYRKHMLQSVTKSFTSVLIGIAIQQGLIDNVDQRMVDFFPDRDIANLDARKQSITLEHLLTMSEGMDWHELDYPYDDPRNTLGQMWVSEDAVQHVLDRPMARDPGERWSYNSGTSIVLGGILEQVTGRSVNAFAREYLFDPIGIGDVFWALTTGGHYHTDGGLYMTPRDMARLGYLMLKNGAWDGREIVSPEWVDQSTTAHYRTPWGMGYGYQWWTLPRSDVYSATGHYDQRIYVSPRYELVVVFTANIADEDPHPTEGWMSRYIIAACTDRSR